MLGPRGRANPLLPRGVRLTITPSLPGRRVARPWEDNMHRRHLVFAAAVVIAAACGLRADDKAAPEGFESLFNGKDLSGWKVPPGDNGHWKVQDGVIDYDARSEARGEK